MIATITIGKKRITGLFFLVMFLMVSLLAKAQDVTIYNSPHDLKTSVSKLYFSIDLNGFTYLNTTEYKTQSFESSQFKGKVQVINFETRDIRKLASCEPTVMLDMPLKILVWEEGHDVFIAFTNAHLYRSRHGIRGCDEVIKSINKAVIRVVNDAIRTH